MPGEKDGKRMCGCTQEIPPVKASEAEWTLWMKKDPYEVCPGVSLVDGGTKRQNIPCRIFHSLS